MAPTSVPYEIYYITLMIMISIIISMLITNNIIADYNNINKTHVDLFINNDALLSLITLILIFTSQQIERMTQKKQPLLFTF